MRLLLLHWNLVRAPKSVPGVCNFVDFLLTKGETEDIIYVKLIIIINKEKGQ